MKVLAINGSPHAKGSTFTAINFVADELKKENVEVEIVHIGAKPIQGCTACRSCLKMDDPRCIFADDAVNECIEKSKSVDGIIFGTPVYFAGIAGSMKCFLDRFFYAGGRDRMQYKVGLGLVALRRSGGVTAFQQLNIFMEFANMMIVGSQYWNVIHGMSAEEVVRDEEGAQIMRTAGKNMAWLMKSVAAGKHISLPEKEPRTATNFIR